MKKRGKKEQIHNLPNLVSLIRIFIMVIILYIIFAGFNFLIIAIVFAIGALTDALDGFFARRFNQKTEFGRKFDMISDRIFMIPIVIGFIIYLIINNSLTNIMLIELVLIMLREIITAPFFIISVVIKGNTIPPARRIAKAVTFFQGVSFVFIILSWPFELGLAIITGVLGIISGVLYYFDFSNNYSK